MKNENALIGQFCKIPNSTKDYVVQEIKGGYAYVLQCDADLEIQERVRLKDLKFFQWKQMREYFNPTRK